ncbi:hypothetical protein [Bdellovibrio sp. HCB274]|uniref:hypothetical protein n=1 Tax=Bdellovibrio sp. HCB274 TaxID=3394361 RepID=UPI0039B5D446
MKFLISVLLLGLTLTACKPVEELDENNPEDTIANQTDYTACNTGGGSSKTIIGSWFYKQGIGNTQFTKTFTFARDYVRVTNDCVFDGAPVRATATSRIVLGINSVSYLDSALGENALQREGYKLVCQSKINPDDLTYRFQGPCLVIVNQAEGTALTLLPATN